MGTSFIIFKHIIKMGLIISRKSLIMKGYVKRIYFKYKYKSNNPNMIIFFGTVTLIIHHIE